LSENKIGAFYKLGKEEEESKEHAAIKQTKSVSQSQRLNEDKKGSGKSLQSD